MHFYPWGIFISPLIRDLGPPKVLRGKLSLSCTNGQKKGHFLLFFFQGPLAFEKLRGDPRVFYAGSTALGMDFKTPPQPGPNSSAASGCPAAKSLVTPWFRNTPFREKTKMSKNLELGVELSQTPWDLKVLDLVNYLPSFPKISAQVCI